MEPQSSSARPHAGYRFGAFQGVYTPSLLTILGVVMYLRFGWVLGNVGLLETLVIVTLSTAITFFTGLSISALASNMKIGAGGAYYIISRSLGVEAGAAIGLPLFLAQGLGIAFYIAGFSESLARLFPALSPVVIGVATLMVLVLLAYKSADLALRTQYLIMALVAASLVSFFLGVFQGSPLVSVSGPPPARLPFWPVFAVFFPAVTGIEAGLAMSGDLKDPARALPRGTLGAILTSYLIYLAIPVALFLTVRDRTLLLTDPLVMRRVSLWGNLILCGLWGAALSSAMGALLGAPRTLQALARDRVVPRFLARGFGRGNDPRLATAAAFLVGLTGILAGGLNVIAPVLSMFFLTSYGLLNLSAALEGLIGSPSWRPEFRVPWGFSMMGAIGCFVTMFMINAGATFTALLAILAIYSLTRRRQLKAYWGDMRYGILILAARFAVYRLAQREPNVRTWQPNILVLSGTPVSGWYLIALADAISQGKGFLTVTAILPEEQAADEERAARLRDSIRDYLGKRRIPALVKICAGSGVLKEAASLIKLYGFGPLQPNTLLIGETERKENIADYVHLVRMTHQSRKNLVIVRESDAPENPLTRFLGADQPPRIDLWWSHSSKSAGFMLALAFLLSTSPEWNNARLVVKTIVDSPEDKEGALEGFERFLKKGRIEAEVEVLIRGEGDVFEAIRNSSQGAELVFLGMKAPKPEESDEAYGRYYESLLTHTEGFPSVAIALAAEEIEFDRIFSAPA